MPYFSYSTMELTEVVSPSVAVPVLCVLVCAFLVFAFGFKSPAQPPSFDVFDEDVKKKRAKKTKVFIKVLILSQLYSLGFKVQDVKGKT